MRKFVIKEGIPKGIKLVMIPLSQLEKLFEQNNELKLSKEDLNILELVSSLAIEVWRLEKRLEMAKVNVVKDSPTDDNAVPDQVQRIKDVFKSMILKFVNIQGFLITMVYHLKSYT